MTDDELEVVLDNAWSDSGVLGRARIGEYEAASGAEFLGILEEMNLAERDQLPHRLVSLLWYVPIFLSWQTDRVKRSGADVQAYTVFSNKVLSCLERKLGVP